MWGRLVELRWSGRFVVSLKFGWSAVSRWVFWSVGRWLRDRLEVIGHRIVEVMKDVLRGERMCRGMVLARWVVVE